MNLLGLSILLTLAGLVLCQEHSQEQEGCRYDLEEIKRNLNTSGNINNLVVNCLAHNGSYAYSISISAFTEDNNTDVRYDFQCVGSTLIPTFSSAVSTIANLACSSCNFTATNPCVTNCSEECGLCANGDGSDCLTCRYLMRVEEHHHDGQCLNRSSCDELGFRATEEGCKCDGYLQPYELHEGDPDYLLPGEEFTYECVDTCNAPNMARGDEFCDVCGVEKCVHCERNRCEECVREYEVFEEGDHDECLTEEEHERREELEELEHLTEELLHEQEIEEEEIEEIELHLRILLPIFCILVVVAGVGLSVIAHYWYPYIDKEGNKRSKTKPSEEEEPTVWRPRPTIRFR